MAANYLLTARKSRVEEQKLTFEAFGADLVKGLAEPASAQPGPEDALLVEEVKIGCTLAMLSCLDRPHRLAYVLGEILEMDHEEAASVLEIAPAAFRKRLSRARQAIVAFTRARCGLVDPSNACRCHRRVGRAVELGRVDPERLLFAHDPLRAKAFPEVLAEIRRLDVMRRAAALYRSHPAFSLRRTSPAGCVSSSKTRGRPDQRHKRTLEPVLDRQPKILTPNASLTRAVQERRERPSTVPEQLCGSGLAGAAGKPRIQPAHALRADPVTHIGPALG